MSEKQNNHDKLTALARELAQTLTHYNEGGISQTAFAQRVSEISKTLTSLATECHRDHQRSALEAMAALHERTMAMIESGIPLAVEPVAEPAVEKPAQTKKRSK